MDGIAGAAHKFFGAKDVECLSQSVVCIRDQRIREIVFQSESLMFFDTILTDTIYYVSVAAQDIIMISDIASFFGACFGAIMIVKEKDV